MRFHEYSTLRPQGFPGSNEDFARFVLRTPMTEPPANIDSRGVCCAGATFRSTLELGWIAAGRPFYNVHPIAVELCQKTKLNMNWGDIVFPERLLALRFTDGQQPFGISSALVAVPTDNRLLVAAEVHPDREETFDKATVTPLGGIYQGSGLHQDKYTSFDFWESDNRDIRDASIETFVDASEEDSDQINFLVKLLAFIGLLARGEDMITPAILAADRSEYDATADESRRKWLENRAARRGGRGFDVCRSLEIARSRSPHWRMPHLALFHTGPGRNVPVLKVRSGCVVIPRDFSEVPTGYLGEERPGEEHSQPTIRYRTQVRGNEKRQVSLQALWNDRRRRSDAGGRPHHLVGQGRNERKEEPLDAMPALQ